MKSLSWHFLVLTTVGLWALPAMAGSINYAAWINTNAEGLVPCSSGNGQCAVDDDPAQIDSVSSASSYSNSQTASVSGASGQGTVSFSYNNGNVGLHGYGNAMSNFAAGGTAAFGDFDIADWDTFYFTGTGYETFQFTLTLEGSAYVNSLSFPYNDEEYGNEDASGYLDLLNNFSCTASANDQPNCSGNLQGEIQLDASSSANSNPYQGGYTMTGTISELAGTTDSIGLELIGRPSVSSGNDGEPALSATFDAGDTGFFTLTPITPGAGFTTASGLTYADSPDAPEPGTVGLAFLGAVAIFCLKRRFWLES